MTSLEHPLEQWSFPKIQSDDEMFQNTQNEISVLQEQVNLKKNEIEIIQQEYQEKIRILENITNEFGKLNPIFIKEITEMIYHLMKQISLRIIKKNITQNPELIQQMIQDVLSNVPSDHGKPIIYLSALDYAQLINDSKESLPFTLEVDSEMQRGDIIIKTNFSEILAKLDARIDLIMSHT